MKKLLTLLFALVAAMSVIGAGCTIAGSSTNPEDLENAKVYLEQLYKNQSETTASDYTLHAQVNVGGIMYKVVWTSSDTENVVIGTEVDENGKITVNVNGETSVEISYVLTARIYDANQNYLETTFNRVIPAYTLTSWEDYLAAEDGATLTIKGIVTSIWGKSLGNTYNGMYVQDLENKGGYYVYGLTSDASAEGVKAGMTVSVTGTYVKNYVELKNASCTILDSTIKTVEPVDYTEIFKNAASLKDEALLNKQTLLVTIKGVELQPQSESDVSGNYYRFKLGNLSSYVRISSSVCPMSKEEQAQFKADFAANVGNKADVTGIASAYNGAFYLVPAGAGAYSNYQVVTKTDAEKVATELDGAFLSKTVFTEAENITLPTVKTYSDVAFAWVSDSEYAVVENGELKITMPSANTTVKITLTATCGEATQTKEFTVTLQNMKLNHAGTLEDPFDCADTLAILNSLATGETYSDEAGTPKAVYIKGYVVVEGTAGNYQSKFYLGATKDTAKEDAVYVYSANYTAAVKSIKLGDCIVVKGFLMDYKGTKEVGQAKVDGTTVFPTIEQSDAQQGGGETPDPDPDPEEPATTTHAGTEEDPFDCKDALTILNSLAKGETYKDEEGNPKAVYIKGYVIVEGTAGNFQSKFYLGATTETAQADGVYVFSANYTDTVKSIKLGDIVVVKGYLMDYNGTKEVARIKQSDGTYLNVEIVSKTEATQEDIAKLVFATLSVKATLNEDYTLPTSTLATIEWSVKEGTAITIEGGVAKVTRGSADAQVVLVAKIGEMTKEFTVTVLKADENPGETKTITFTCGDDGEEKHYDTTAAKATYTEIVDGVTLTIESGTNLYLNCRDAKGNGCLKLGTGSKAGSFKITSIPAGVKSIKIYVAGYKANAATVTANGEATKLTKMSNDGEYDVIEVLIAEGTTEVTFEVSLGYRAMVNAIEFVY